MPDDLDIALGEFVGQSHGDCGTTENVLMDVDAG